MAGFLGAAAPALTLFTAPQPAFAQVTAFKQAVAEAYRNICAIGACPLAITNNLNFGNPEKPDIMTQLAQSIVGMGKAAKQLDTPVVSGNVSLYNETDGVAIRPCPVVGMVGVIDDVTMAIGNRFVAADERLLERLVDTAALWR